MGRTYEAIQRAEKEYQKTLRESGIRHEERFWLSLNLDNAPEPPVADGYKDIKTKLLTHYADESIKVILLAGPDHDTGTTTTAITLARDLAGNSRKKVLLVDANLRTPVLHKVFRIKPSAGVSDLLADNGHKVFNFYKVGSTNLYVFPAGIRRKQQNGYFESQRLDQFLNQARKQFDYIIIDSAPVSRFQDSQSLVSGNDFTSRGQDARYVHKVEFLNTRHPQRLLKRCEFVYMNADTLCEKHLFWDHFSVSFNILT